MSNRQATEARCQSCILLCGTALAFVSRNLITYPILLRQPSLLYTSQQVSRHPIVAPCWLDFCREPSMFPPDGCSATGESNMATMGAHFPVGCCSPHSPRFSDSDRDDDEQAADGTRVGVDRHMCALYCFLQDACMGARCSPRLSDSDRQEARRQRTGPG